MQRQHLTLDLNASAVFLARHGRTAENAARRILGRRDPPLDAIGQEQARELAELVRRSGIAAVWTSPLRRAAGTARIAATVLGKEAIVLQS